LDLPTLKTTRFGNMSHQTDDTPQSESAGHSRPRSAKPFSARTADGWPEIDASLLEDARPLLPPAPLDVLPQPWRDWVSDAACGAGAPVDYVVQALLAAVAGLAGVGVRACVKPPWSQPLVLWQALVGASSTGKTPALEAIGCPLAAVEKLLSREACAGTTSREQGKGAVVVHDARESDRVRLSCVGDLLEKGIALAGIAEIRPAARAQKAPSPATSRARREHGQKGQKGQKPKSPAETPETSRPLENKGFSRAARGRRKPAETAGNLSRQNCALRPCGDQCFGDQ
jgi:Protein of unknown function (DUF3987)